MTSQTVKEGPSETRSCQNWGTGVAQWDTALRCTVNRWGSESTT